MSWTSGWLCKCFLSCHCSLRKQCKGTVRSIPSVRRSDVLKLINCILAYVTHGNVTVVARRVS